MDDVLHNVKKRQIEKKIKLLCKERSWVGGNESPLVGDGAKGWVNELWNVSDLVEFKLLKILAVDIIVWISWINSWFVIDDNANWRTVNRIFIVSILTIDL